MKTSRFAVIACRILFREISLLSTRCPNVLDVTWLRQELHDHPETLQTRLQAAIDAIDRGDEERLGWRGTVRPESEPEAILIAYGLCSNGTVGISSARHTLVIPRAHDCVTLLLGSRERYRDYFDAHKGVYWYTRGWIERTPMPGEDRFRRVRQEYTEKYGEENADYLMEMEQDWMREYRRATYIDWPELDDGESAGYTRGCADFLGWEYDEVPGDPVLLADLLAGRWDPERFLVVPPGGRVAASFDDGILKVGEE